MPGPESPAIIVALPAKDEAEQLPITLAALAAQRGVPAFGVLVLVNNSVDDSAEKARAFADRLCLRVVECQLPPPQANVVGARRAALDQAAVWAGEHGIIVSTDADTTPAPGWLRRLLEPLWHGTDASAGRILLRAEERAQLHPAARRTYLYDTAYRLAAADLTARLDPLAHDPAPRHAQHFGANLALTVRAYRAVGGIPEVSRLEDVALVDALLRADLRLRHTLQARVYTSARVSGRVPMGLSTQLGEWFGGPEGWLVPGGPEIAALARAQAAFRLAYVSGRLGNLAKCWLTAAVVLRQTLAAPTLGQGLECAHRARVQSGVWDVLFRPVPVRQALQDLRLLAHEQVQAVALSGVAVPLGQQEP